MTHQFAGFDRGDTREHGVVARHVERGCDDGPTVLPAEALRSPYLLRPTRLTSADDRLRALAGDRTGAIDLGKDGGVKRLPEGIDRGPDNVEVGFEAGTRIPDCDQVTRPQILELGEDRRTAQNIVDVAGYGRRARLAWSSTAAVPEDLLPDRIAGRAGRRIHHVPGRDPHSQDGRADAK